MELKSLENEKSVPAASSARGWKWAAAGILLLVLVADLHLAAWQKTAPVASFWAAPAIRLLVRLSVVVLALAGWFFTQSLIGARSLADHQIGDALHDWTESWNAYLHRHPRLTNGLLIGTSAGIDLFGLFLIGSGIFGPTLRPFIGLLMVFAFRQMCQAICALPLPPRMIWRHPGFPSLLVTYGVANDFFISGHTALAVLGAIEISRQLPWWCGVLAALVAILEASTVIVLRAHYTMDVLAAVVAAWTAADLAALCPG